MNGKDNLWIMKNAITWSGIGISVHHTYESIMEEIASYDGKKVVMKYVENPMLINQRKFDIRQWVLVTDWNPLTIYSWTETYAKLASNVYDPDSKDTGVHLTNVDLN